MIITTSMLGSVPLIRRSSSMPSICGILMSMKMRSGRKVLRVLSAASPLSAIAISYRGFRIMRSDSRGPISSSTTSTFGRSLMAAPRPAARR